MIATFLALGLLNGPFATPVDLQALTPGELVCSSIASNSETLDPDLYLLDPNAAVEVCQREVSPGAATFSYTWPTGRIQLRTIWGSSYARSEEIVDLYYVGKARAAGNIFLNERIVRVCIWYTRDSVAITNQVCSNASSESGVWLPGPEVTVSAWDILVWDAPKTIFNMKVTRISPTIY
jgi:hypothetical protein